jgi:hypothetical protein
MSEDKKWKIETDERPRPKCKLVGEDGNAFAIMGRTVKALRKADQSDLVSEYHERATSGDYDNLLQVTMEYVEEAGDSDEE